MKFILNPFTHRLDAYEADVGPAGDVESITGDSGGAVGPDASGNISLLGSPDLAFAGTPGTNSFAVTDLVKITPFVVDAAAGAAPYSTIQSAITAAEATGNDETVYVREGTYTENLTFTNGKITLVGASERNTTIDGTHTPPTTGYLSILRMSLTDATYVISSAAAGTARLFLEDVTTTVTNGYTFNLTNWLGPIIVFDVGGSGTNDGFIYNTAGAGCLICASGVGDGTGNVMTLSGTTYILSSGINCPLAMIGASELQMLNSYCIGYINSYDTSELVINNSSIESVANVCLTLASTTEAQITNTVLDTNNAYAIDGIGSVLLTGVSYVDSHGINTTITQTHTGVTETGKSYCDTLSLDRELYHLKTTATAVTSGATTSDIVTIDLGSTPAAYTITANIVGYRATNATGIGYSVTGTIRATGGVATIIGTPDKIVNEDGTLAGADVNLIASGNNAVIRLTGVAGADINWRVVYEYVKVTG